MNKKVVLLSVGILLGIIFYVVGKKIYQGSSNTGVELANQDLVRSSAVKLGSENPKVVLVEFLDPECEACAAFYPYVKDFLAKYSNLQLVIRYLPLHPNSQFAVKMLEAARLQGKYKEMMELMFTEQSNWGNHNNPNPDYLWTLLEKLELNLDKLKQDMELTSIQSIIDEDMNKAKELNLRATPSFFVNGKPLTQFSQNALEIMIINEK